MLISITAERTFEDPSEVDPSERLSVFGQEDHVRRFGTDFIDRVREAGFKVKVSCVSDLFEKCDIIFMGLTPVTGELNVKVPRVRDRREGDVEKAQFSSSIFPPYLRRADRICTLSQNEKERMTRLNYAAAIDRLLPDPELREQMCAKGLLRAKCFSWQESADKLLQICCEVVG